MGSNEGQSLGVYKAWNGNWQAKRHLLGHVFYFGLAKTCEDAAMLHDVSLIRQLGACCSARMFQIVCPVNPDAIIYIALSLPCGVFFPPIERSWTQPLVGPSLARRVGLNFDVDARFQHPDVMRLLEGTRPNPDPMKFKKRTKEYMSMMPELRSALAQGPAVSGPSSSRGSPDAEGLGGPSGHIEPSEGSDEEEEVEEDDVDDQDGVRTPWASHLITSIC